MDNIIDRMDPKYAIIVYGGEEFNHIEYREFVKNKMGAAKQMSIYAMAQLFSAFRKSESDSYGSTKFIERRILHLDFSPKLIIAWYIPSSKKRIRFASHVNENNDLDGDYTTPGLVFVNIGTKLYIGGVKKGFKESSSVFKAPFFNQFSDSGMCMPPKNPNDIPFSLADRMEYFESQFFNSLFTLEGDFEQQGYKSLVTIYELFKGKKKELPLITTINRSVSAWISTLRNK